MCAAAIEDQGTIRKLRKQHPPKDSCLRLLRQALTLALYGQEFVTTRPGDKEPVCGRQEYSVTEDRPIEKVQTWLMLAAQAFADGVWHWSLLL